jgi:thiol-disulfide isomerase/thioredoxin
MDLEQNRIQMPEIPLSDKMNWFNAQPEIVRSLKGRVVLVDFWEYTCVNCIRTLPYVKAWNERYADKGLLILGVHAPEFEFGKNRENVGKAVNEFGLSYPIVMDNNYTIWRIFRNRYWPEKYIFDKSGILRHYHFGEGGYGETEGVIQKLLLELNPNQQLPNIMKPVRETDVPGAVCYRATPETYLGFERGQIANREKFRENEIAEFQDPGKYEDDRFYLDGRWWIGPENIRFSSKNGEPGRILLNYAAAEVNLVIRSDQDIPFKVYIEQDGRALGVESKGDDAKADTDGRTYLLVDGSRMYQVIRNKNFGRHDLKVTTNSKGFFAYAFTFVSACQDPMER